MNRKTLKSILLFLVLTILMQLFYVVSTSTDFFSSSQYFPYGYSIHVIYYLSFLAITFLFVGRLDLRLVGLKSVVSWRKYLLLGILLAILDAALKIVFVQGTFGKSFYAEPYFVILPAFLFLGTLIALSEESAFRGYLFKNLSERYSLIASVLLASFLFGIYHINYPNLNYFTSLFWTLYAVQALTGGLIMVLLFHKTGNNLIAPIGYHATNIIIGQAILWTPSIDAGLVLGIEILINVALAALLNFIPIGQGPKT